MIDTIPIQLEIDSNQRLFVYGDESPFLTLRLSKKSFGTNLKACLRVCFEYKDRHNMRISKDYSKVCAISDLNPEIFAIYPIIPDGVKLMQGKHQFYFEIKIIKSESSGETNFYSGQYSVYIHHSRALTKAKKWFSRKTNRKLKIGDNSHIRSVDFGAKYDIEIGKNVQITASAIADSYLEASPEESHEKFLREIEGKVTSHFENINIVKGNLIEIFDIPCVQQEDIKSSSVDQVDLDIEQKKVIFYIIIFLAILLMSLFLVIINQW